MPYIESETKAKIREITTSAEPVLDGITKKLAYYEVSNEHFQWLLGQAEKAAEFEERNIQNAFTIEKKNIQIDDLTHELLFYSDPSNYIAIAHLSEQSRLAEDLGERARKALRRKR